MTDKIPTALGVAELSWTDAGAPRSDRHQDIYFSLDNGLAETRYVFLDSNDIAERMKATQNKVQPSHFVIGETGFGTGLNFLASWQARDRSAPHCFLHFVSVEKYPLRREDLIRALSAWPELTDYSAQLIARWPEALPGWHRLSFTEAKVELSLFLGDAVAGLSHCHAKIDAWYLDGFAPAKNASMWCPELFQQMARLSQANTSFATFTAAAQVREGLKSAGFQVDKVKGFGQKRHMLKGHFIGKPLHTGPATLSATTETPGPEGDYDAIIIGGGLAGTHAAYSLARRGLKVALFEQQDALAKDASGNRQGVLYTKLSAKPSIASDFYRSAFCYAQQHYQQLQQGSADPFWHPCGVLQLAYDSDEAARQEQFLCHHAYPASFVQAVSAEEASDMAGVTLNQGGLFFPQGGWLYPPTLCRQLVQHQNISVHLNQRVAPIEHINNCWTIKDQAQKVLARAPQLVLATAAALAPFTQLADFPVKAIRGQTSHLPTQSSLLKTVLCGKGYVGPAIAGRHYFGATFNLRNDDTALRLEDHEANLQQLAELCPALAQELGWPEVAPQAFGGKVGFRCTTPDYLPIVGPVADRAQLQAHVSGLRRKKEVLHLGLTDFSLPGLYISIGHGSKGLASCPLSAELLSAYILNEPFPIAPNLARALHPRRFSLRQFKVRHA